VSDGAWWGGWFVNVALRASMAGMLAVVVRAGSQDPRFTNKGIATRFLTFGMPATLFVPAVWAMRRGSLRRYPVWTDNLYLSILALDLSANVLDLYDRYFHFDLIPHAHGTGAATIVIAELFEMPLGQAATLATVGHLLLEGQEFASDVLFGLRNVRGWWDVAGDLGAGFVGTIAYGIAYQGRLASRSAVRAASHGDPRETP
jgi:hypothetical protein